MASVSHPGAAFGDYEKWLGSLGAIRGDNELFPLVFTLHQGCSCSHGLKSPGLLSACGHQASFLRAGPDPEPSAEGPAGSSGEGQGSGGRGAQPPSSSTSAAPGPSCLCPPLLGLLSGTPVSVCVCMHTGMQAHRYHLLSAFSALWRVPQTLSTSRALETTWPSFHNDQKINGNGLCPRSFKASQ